MKLLALLAFLSISPSAFADVFLQMSGEDKTDSSIKVDAYIRFGDITNLDQLDTATVTNATIYAEYTGLGIDSEYFNGTPEHFFKSSENSAYVTSNGIGGDLYFIQNMGSITSSHMTFGGANHEFRIRAADYMSETEFWSAVPGSEQSAPMNAGILSLFTAFALRRTQL
jgi:hypothetical protein